MGTPNDSPFTGPCAAAIHAVSVSGRSAANTAWNFAGSMVRKPAASGTIEVARRGGAYLPWMSVRFSPASGAKAATYTRALTSIRGDAGDHRAAVGVADEDHGAALRVDDALTVATSSA